jgi:malate permease and related proteins
MADGGWRMADGGLRIFGFWRGGDGLGWWVLGSYPEILGASLPVYLTLVAGGVARRWGVLTAEAERSLMRMGIGLLFPCLIVSRSLGSEELMRPGPVLAAAGLGFGLVVLGVLVSLAVAPLFGLRVGEGRRTFAVAAGLQNYGFVAIPVAAALFSEGTVAMLFVFAMGVEAAMWVVGVGVMVGVRKTPWRLLLSPPLLAILGSVLVNWSGLWGVVPDGAQEFVLGAGGFVGASAIPLMLLLVGAVIYELLGSVGRMGWRVPVAGVLLRVVVLPVPFLLLAWCLPVPETLKQVLVVQAAMPSAVFTVMLARHYGGHPETAVQVIVATTVVSVVSLPLVVGLGMWLIGGFGGI